MPHHGPPVEGEGFVDDCDGDDDCDGGDDDDNAYDVIA